MNAIGRQPRNQARVYAVCEFFEADLAEIDQYERAIAFVREQFERVGLKNGSSAKLTERLRQNPLHYFALTHFAFPLLRESQGAIVNISSKLAVMRQGGTSPDQKGITYQ